MIEQSPGAGARLDIEVKSPSVRHVLTMRQVQIGSTNPNEEAERKRLCEILHVK